MGEEGLVADSEAALHSYTATAEASRASQANGWVGEERLVADKRSALPLAPLPTFHTKIIIISSPISERERPCEGRLTRIGSLRWGRPFEYHDEAKGVLHTYTYCPYLLSPSQTVCNICATLSL